MGLGSGGDSRTHDQVRGSPASAPYTTAAYPPLNLLPPPSRPPKAGLGAQTMLSPPKQGKIIKPRAVNSFPTGLGHCAPTLPLPPGGRDPRHKPQEASGLQGLQECPCLPRPLSSPYKKEGRRLGSVEQHQGRAFPTLLPSQALSCRPLPRIAQGQAGAGHPFLTHRWLTRWGN